MTTLVIVESPGKVKKISSLLGQGYQVMASVGHVRDLPKDELGITPGSWRLDYSPTERGKDVLQRLAAAVKRASVVLLATDPDREGEAIAWHLADALGLSDAQRITFSAITAEQVKRAVQSPRPIDMDLVHAQEARRALDRIVGYRVSPALSNIHNQALSAGRVQSPALRLVVDREREIANFKVTEHYGARLTFDGEAGPWVADWNVKPLLDPGQQYMLDDQLALAVAKVRDVVVAAAEDSEQLRSPPAPFITSTLQQVASSKLKLKPKRVMEVAQALYERGLITYHRTDSPNLDPAGIEAITAFANAQGWPVADQPRRFKAKESAQEGHEAIRPTEVELRELDDASADEKAIYALVWQRAVAAVLAPAKYAVRSVTLAAKIDQPETSVEFLAKGRTLIEPGWMVLQAEDEQAETADEDTPETPVPQLAVEDPLTASDGQLLTRKTKPPPRFKQATLIRELEKQGIGRPSTYAAILDNIIVRRSYIDEDKKGWLVPAKTGEVVRDSLVGRFDFADLDYTRELELELDAIAGGTATYADVVAGVWGQLDKQLPALAAADIKPAWPCPSCGKAMGRRKGSNGFFWGCAGYPECRVTLPDAKGKPGERKAVQLSEHPCPECERPMIRRKGKSKGRAYDFYSCSGYPDCKATQRTAEDGTPVPAAS